MNTKQRFSKFLRILVILGLILGTAVSAAYAQEDVPQAPGAVSSQLPPAGSAPVEGQPGSSSGWFNIIWGDGRDGGTETIYTLTDDGGQTTRLFVDQTLSRSVGGVLWFNRKRVNVTGVSATSRFAAGAVTGLQVTSISLAPAPGAPGAQAVSGDVSAAVIGSRPWVTIMCRFSDVAAEPKDLAFFTGMYANTKPGMDHYWRELSYDTANVAGSTAYGWFTLPQPVTYYNPNCDTGGEPILTKLFNDCTRRRECQCGFFALQRDKHDVQRRF